MQDKRRIAVPGRAGSWRHSQSRPPCAPGAAPGRHTGLQPLPPLTRRRPSTPAVGLRDKVDTNGDNPGRRLSARDPGRFWARTLNRTAAGGREITPKLSPPISPGLTSEPRSRGGQVTQGTKGAQATHPWNHSEQSQGPTRLSE